MTQVLWSRLRVSDCQGQVLSGSHRGADPESTYPDLLQKLIRFRTVASQYEEDEFRGCVAELSGIVTDLGFTCVWEGADGVPPVGVCLREVSPDAPWIVLYQHYDVQPSGAPEDWVRPPYSGFFDGVRCHGRGAQDNKGQLCYVLEALHEIYLANLPLNVCLVLDGEEEIGSPNLSLRALNMPRRNLLGVVSFDSIMPREGVVPLVISCRGYAAVFIEIETGRVPVHSGFYAGGASNAASVLVGALDHVATVIHSIKGGADLQSMNGGIVEETLRSGQLSHLVSYEQHELLRQMTADTRLEIVGIESGDAVRGQNIPVRACARVIVRSAPGASIEDVLQIMESEINRYCEGKAKVCFRMQGRPLQAFSSTPDNHLIVAAEDACRHIGMSHTVVRDGGCSPGLCLLTKELGVPGFVTGFGMVADNIHAPNESFSFKQYQLGQSFAKIFFEKLGNLEM